MLSIQVLPLEPVASLDFKSSCLSLLNISLTLCKLRNVFASLLITHLESRCFVCEDPTHASQGLCSSATPSGLLSSSPVRELGKRLFCRAMETEALVIDCLPVLSPSHTWANPLFPSRSPFAKYRTKANQDGAHL